MIGREVALLGAPDTAIGQPQAKTKGVQAMQLNLTSDVIEELLECIKSGKTPQILLGNNPVLRYHGKSLSLETHPEKFQHEIYRSDNGQDGDTWEFAGLVSQKMSVKRHEEATAGVDHALEVLQSRMADAKREREAQTAILATPDLLPTKPKSHIVKNSSLLKPPTNSNNRSLPSSPGVVPAKSPAATSAPQASDEEMGISHAIKWAAMIVLAINGPMSTTEIGNQIGTRQIPALRDTLHGIAIKEMDGKDAIWRLTDNSFRPFTRRPGLDPWTINITDEQRAAIIKRCAKAFGRLRVDKMSPAWRKLLPVEDRDKDGWWEAFSQYQLKTDNIKANTPAMKPMSFDSKTGLPKKSDPKRSDKPKASQTDKSNGTPKVTSTTKGTSQKPEKESKPSASAKSLLNSKPKNPSPLSKSPPVNASDFSQDHPVHKKLAASPSPQKRKAEEPAANNTPNKRSRLDPSSADKKENGAPSALKRKASDLSSPSSAHSSASKKAKSSAALVNGAKPHAPNGVHVPPVRTDTPHDSSSSEDSSSPVELTWHQKVKLAQNFKRYYGRYKARHEELSAKTGKGEVLGEEEEGELWAMHKRLEAMKAKIYGGVES